MVGEDNESSVVIDGAHYLIYSWRGGGYDEAVQDGSESKFLVLPARVPSVPFQSSSASSPAHDAPEPSSLLHLLWQPTSRYRRKHKHVSDP